MIRRCLAAAAALVAPAASKADQRRPTWAFVVFLPLLLTGILLVARDGLLRHPQSGDEYSCLLQGEIFSRGVLAVPAPPHAELLHVDHVVIDTMVRSKYPPGWPAWLALGWLLHAPWIVCPFVGCAALAILFITARRMYGVSGALTATLLVGVSPFFVLNAASYHSHCSALFASAIFLWALTGTCERGRMADAIMAGAGFGLLAITRPGDALPLALSVVVLLRRPKLLAGVALGIAPFAALMLAYQAKQYGGMFRSGYDAHVPEFMRQYGTGSLTVLSREFATSPAIQWAHLQWFTLLAGEFLAPFTMTLAVLGLALGRPPAAEKTTAHRALVIAFLAQLAMVIPTRGEAGDGYGPRYLFTLLGPGTLLIAAGYARAITFLARHSEWQRIAGIPAAAFAAALVVTGIRDAKAIGGYHALAIRSSALYRDTVRAGLHDAVVILYSYSPPTRYARNGASFDGPILYVAARGVDPQVVAAAFPTRKIYLAYEGPEHWSIRALNP